MIDFRYHIVSIVAVFLALAVGIVLGTYTINGQLLKNIRDQVKSLRSDNDGLRDRIRTLESEVGHDRAFVSAVAPMLIDSQLSRQRVLIVLTPGASGGLGNDVADTIREAGGTVTGTVKVGKGWTDPTQTATIGDLATRVAEPGVTLPDGSAYDRAGRVIAAALLDQPQDAASSSSLSAADMATLAAFREAKLISVSPERPVPANLVVVVAADAPDQSTEEDQQAASTLTTLARQFDVAGNGAVVVGAPASAESGGLVADVRRDGDINEFVSTVDDVDTTTGEVRAVLALAAELRGISGQYGVGPGAGRPAPSPEAAPSP